MKQIDITLPSRNILTVDALNQRAKHCLEQNLGCVWVEGELSNCAKPSSGHVYFTLKSRTAQIRCALFKFKQSRLGFSLDNGQHVIVSAKVSLFEGRGDYQLIVDTVEEIGDGQLQREFEALKQKLAKEGLFAPEHKRSLPTLAKQIGIITSATGAAIKDIISVTARRFPWIPLVVYPSLVQGTQTAASLTSAIARAITDNRCDVLIISRGGGSLEDLWGFNDETLARAIFNCPIPVISAVGHEIDFTISDFVADVRAPTPSAAAELVTPDIKQWLQTWQNKMAILNKEVKQHLQALTNDFRHLTKRLASPVQQVEKIAQQLDAGEQQLTAAMQRYWQNQRQHTQQLYHRLSQYSPIHKLTQCQEQLQSATRALDAVSPLATLARGYSITQTVKGDIVKASQDVRQGDAVKVKLHQGTLNCEVISTSH